MHSSMGFMQLSTTLKDLNPTSRSSPCAHAWVSGAEPLEVTVALTLTGVLNNSAGGPGKEGQGNEAGEDETDGDDAHSLVGDATQDGVDPEEVPLGHDVLRGGVGVGGHQIVWMSQEVRHEQHEHA